MHGGIRIMQKKIYSTGNMKKRQEKTEKDFGAGKIQFRLGSSEKEISKIVDKATEEYKANLTEQDIANIKAVMGKINNLDLNYNNLKDQLDDVTNQLKDKLTSAEAKGFFAKLEKMFSDLLQSVKEAFSK